MSGSARIDILPVARLVLAIALLAMPARVLSWVSEGQPDRRGVVVARILGARQLTEAAILMAWPRRFVAALGAGVDGVHAVTAAAVALATPRDRRLALTNFITATGFALAGLLRARSLGHASVGG